MQKELDIIMLSTVVDAPFYCKDKIVKCVTEWTPIGESTKKVGELSICVNHSEHVLQYYKPQELYIIEEIENNRELNMLLNSEEYLIFRNEQLEVLTRSEIEGIGKYYKIIASTNPLIDCPRIDKKFIIDYIKNYNNNTVIKMVVVEYYYKYNNLIIDTVAEDTNEPNFEPFEIMINKIIY